MSTYGFVATLHSLPRHDCYVSHSTAVEGVRTAGIKLSPGTYHVSPKVEDGYHLHFACTRGRTASFELDFSGVFFYFVVSFSSIKHAIFPISKAVSSSDNLFVPQSTT